MSVAAPCLVCGAPAREGGYCPGCETARPGTRKRLRTRYWRRLSAAYRRTHPFCEWAACGKRANVVDHRVPRDQGGTDAWSNLQALCHGHHAVKTRQDTAA